jgi:outer membrane protein assembly factor BamB
MKNTKTTIALLFSFLMGMGATSLMSGCQPPKPVAEGTNPNNTIAAVDPAPADPTPVESAPVEPAPVEPPAVGTVDNPVDPSANGKIVAGEWGQWGGNSYRNNVPIGKNIPVEWAIGDFDRKTGDWDNSDAENILWVAKLGSQSYGNPVVAGGRVFIGTNNGAANLKRYSDKVDLGCLVCINEADGSFLWQHSSEKLSTGRVHDWPLQGICCAPLVEGENVYFVSSRGHVICADINGYHDGKDNGIPASWGRLFDLPKNDDPEMDQVAPALAALAEGNVNDVVRAKLAAAGMELPEEVKLEAGEKPGSFMITATIGDVERKIRIGMGGPKLSAFKLTTVNDTREADEIWSFDMMKELGTSQHNMCSCSVSSYGDILFVNTSNGLDESHIILPAPDAPSFIAMDKKTGKVLWTDRSPAENILHGQWSSPAIGVLGGVPQVIFAGGDGWVYSFKADEGKDGKPELLWKFDANPKESKWILGGRGTRNNIIATPVIYDGLVYVAVGQDPEHGEGQGHLWCINPHRRGDVSPQLAMKIEGDKRVPLPPRRLQAIIGKDGEVAVDNENSAVIWHYSKFDLDGNGKIDFEETMHRSCGTVAIKNDILYIADFSGLFHCLNAKTGKLHWTYDMFAAAWGSPLIVGDHVYIGDEDGDLSIFELSTEAHDPTEINMDNSVYSTPIVANDVLYIATKNKLFAIGQPKSAE